MSSEVQIIFSAGGQFYAIPDVKRECGLWLSLAKHALPVPNEWHRPGLSFAAVMRGRDYWRIGHNAPMHTDGSKAVSIDDELVTDYRDASWWTPGLQESWVEAEGFKLAAQEAARSADTRRSVAEPSTGVCDVRTAREARDSKRGKANG
jgi:hypothetical protein